MRAGRWWLIMKDGTRRLAGPLHPYTLDDIQYAEYEKFA